MPIQIEDAWKLAQESQTMSIQAIAKISEHEAVCTERWTTLRDIVGKLDTKLDQLMNTHNRSTGVVSTLKYGGHFLSAILGALAAWAMKGIPLH